MSKFIKAASAVIIIVALALILMLRRNILDSDSRGMPRLTERPLPRFPFCFSFFQVLHFFREQITGIGS